MLVIMFAAAVLRVVEVFLLFGVVLFVIACGCMWSRRHLL